jgi:PAS domain S-box-containing protein
MPGAAMKRKGKELETAGGAAKGLRNKAERRLQSKETMPEKAMDDGDVRALLHELQVHQIELEMQNEELLHAQTAVQEVSDNYRDLFDFAPVGYFRLDKVGKILEVNLAGAELFGLDRGSVLGKRFGQFIATEYRSTLAEFYKRGTAAAEKRNCEIKCQCGDQWKYVLLEVRFSPDDKMNGSCRITATDITERKRVEEALQQINISLEQRVTKRTAELQRQTDQLRALAMELSQTEQRERKRLAKILHDHIQQLLVAARMQIELLRRDDDADRMRALAQGVDSILGETLGASRSLTVELSPPTLESAGLIGSLNWLASRMQEKNHFTVNLHVDNEADQASEEARLLLFECARELLFNAMKHSGAAEAHVTLMGTKDHHIKLVIRDEGKGFDPDMLEKRREAESTFGLFSVQQRMVHIGGFMEISTPPGKGTSITLTVPAEKAQPLPTSRAKPR